MMHKAFASVLMQMSYDKRMLELKVPGDIKSF